MRRRYLWPSYDIWPQQTRAVSILSNLLAWLPDCYLPWQYTGKAIVLHANYSFRPATWNHRERRDVRIHFHPLIVVLAMVSKKWSVLQRDHMAFGCLRPCRVPWDALIYKREALLFVCLSSPLTTMAGTYTHKFDTPSYKGDVTINTGWVLFLWTGWYFDSMS